MSAWKQACAARAALESEADGRRTRLGYTEVMDRFRAIYHGDPGNLYAPRAVNAVAELLAEQGRDLRDRKSLRDAAGQYEFLTRAYPKSSLAPTGLLRALVLLAPDVADDPLEAAKVEAMLHQQFPHLSMGDQESQGRARPTSAVANKQRPPVPGEPGLEAGQPASGGRPGLTSGTGQGRSSVLEAVDDQQSVPGAAPAMVTGIRHWSTSTYTRVAIDLGGEVQFEAARVEHPDRIFFDLHGAKLAPGLVGRSFNITDEGFLKTIRAGQFGANITRIVLDVQPVAEYSAFLLPNPTRLIIDIHGKPAASKPGATLDAGYQQKGMGTRAPSPLSNGISVDDSYPPLVAPAVHSKLVPEGKHAADGASSLPPMPVTDGSAGFGLPKRHSEPVANVGVARPRVVISAKPTPARPVPNTVVSLAPETTREVAAVSDSPGIITASPKPTSQPVVDRARGAKAAAKHPDGPTERLVTEPGRPVPPPSLTAEGRNTLLRALGLKIGRIVIDAGHGGHDSGTLGVDGLEEKDVVLDVALRLGRLLHDRLGAEIVYTRADDIFIPLETRTAIANKAQADLFISIHANSSVDPSARGVEVYYLNFTSDPEAMQVAGRENAVSSQRVNQLSDLVKKIALKDKIDESRELAADVDTALFAGLRKGNEGLKDRGVKKAPFVVLIGANMPSILAEISFVTNLTDAQELSRTSYRERVAESLYNGVARYAASVNGVGAPNRVQRADRAAVNQGNSEP